VNEMPPGKSGRIEPPTAPSAPSMGRFTPGDRTAAEPHRPVLGRPGAGGGEAWRPSPERRPRPLSPCRSHSHGNLSTSTTHRSAGQPTSPASGIETQGTVTVSADFRFCSQICWISVFRRSAASRFVQGSGGATSAACPTVKLVRGTSCSWAQAIYEMSAYSTPMS
jgi:hypothetical protein